MMAKLIKFKRINFGNYFKELSIVIIGVAVTLAASSVISTISEKRDLKLQMNAIYAELEDNLAKVNKLNDFYQDTRKLNEYLMKDYRNPGTAYEDSLMSLNRIVGKVPGFVYKRNAYDMFINSGGMKSFKDKKLLLDITECYALLEILNKAHQVFTGSIIELLKDIYSMETEKIVGNIGIKDFPNFYNFHLMSSADYENSELTIKMINKVLSKRK